MQALKPGDKLTIAGAMVPIKNPSRKWWQFWKPRMVAGPVYREFVIVTAFRR